MSDLIPAEAIQWLREAISAQLGVYPTIEQATTILSAYDAGRRELAERFANQDKTRKAAIEELMAWEDEHEALSAHPAEETGPGGIEDLVDAAYEAMIAEQDVDSTTLSQAQAAVRAVLQAQRDRLAR